VPAGIVELKHDALVVPGAHRSGKSTTMSSNKSLQTALAMFLTVRPVAGSTKPVTSRPLRRSSNRSLELILSAARSSSVAA